MEDDMRTRAAADGAIAGAPTGEAGEGDDGRAEAVDVPAIDVDERLADEAGYGYGV